MKRSLRLAFFSAAMICGFAGLAGMSGQAASTREIVVIPIEGTVDEGMAHMVQRAVRRADEDHAEAIVLDVNTPGGLLDAAFQIRDALLAAKEPTVAFVSHRAYSAGALISLSAKTIVMEPGASIGAAEPIPNDPKHVAAVRSEFQSTAERNHRDVTLAEAMVDKNVDAPAYKKTGAILSLSAADAVRAKIADGMADNLDDAVKTAGLAPAPYANVDYSFGERVARFATNPEVSGLLLSLGMLGLLIEMQTLHGIAGLIGIGALGLFFGTHVYAGFSDGFVVALALAGVLGILFELHVVPGHGIAGVLGVIALLAAVVLSFGVAFFFVAVQSISIAIVLSVLAFWLTSRVYHDNAFVRRIAFNSAQGAEYVASADYRGLIGHDGVATSLLRPAGVATFEGHRVPVLTEGGFVAAGSPIRVTRVEGSRIFVEPIKE
jgi:membrane-bound serine protease (ClpP class)